MLGARGGPEFLRSRAGKRADAAGLGGVDLDNLDQRVVLGLIDAVPVGLGVGRIVRWGPGFDEGGGMDQEDVGLIEDLFVEAGARSVGLGELLLGDLLAWFAGRGVTDIDARTLPGDRATKNFFEASGFKARLLVMHRQVKDRDKKP
ncbi:MAG: GNAT family N-acetyltransferase [Acidimicrobiales bacterium]